MFNEADEILRILKEVGVEIRDHPFNEGGHSTWYRVPHAMESAGKGIMDLAHEAVYYAHQQNETRISNIVEAAVDSLERDKDVLTSMSTEKPLRKDFISREMQGRKYADAAFHFAVSGVSDTYLYDLLVNGTIFELKRFGHRNSSAISVMLQMAEKLAIAGVKGHEVYDLVYSILSKKSNAATAHSYDYHPLGFCLFSERPLYMLWRYTSKEYKYGNQNFVAEQAQAQRHPSASSPVNDVNSNRIAIERVSDADTVTGGDEDEQVVEDLNELNSEPFDPPTDGVTRRYQQLLGSQKFIFQTSLLPNLYNYFQDLSKPLIVDLGSGFGVPLLGLSTWQQQMSSQSAHEGGNAHSPHTSHHVDFNYLGCDLSPVKAGYANGIAKRWDLSSFCHVVISDAVQLLDHIRMTYPGPVACIMLNFPTPYSQSLLSMSGDGSSSTVGNRQLPTRLEDFMVTRELLEKAARALSGGRPDGWERRVEACRPGYLYLQSNVEDVAVTVENMVRQMDNYGVPGGLLVPNHPEDIPDLWGRHEPLQWVENDSCNSSAPTSRRQALWVERGGARAQGRGWLSSSPLPCIARTETEVMCARSGKPVHRICFLSVSPEVTQHADG